MRAVPRFTPDRSYLPGIRAHSELFPFLRGFARYIPRSVSRALVSGGLSTAVPAWLQEVRVVELTFLPHRAKHVVRVALRDAVVFPCYLSPKRFLCISGYRVEGVAWDHDATFREYPAGAKHYGQLRPLARWRGPRAVCAHPPTESG